MRERILLLSFCVFYFSGSLFVRDLHSRSLGEEEKLIRVGVGAFKDGFFDVAEKQFSQYLRDYPNHGKTYDVSYLLAKSLLTRGRLKEARVVFYRILNEDKSFEHTDYTLFWTAQTEIQLGNAEGARRVLLSLIQRFPKFEWNGDSCYLLGLLDLKEKKFTTAETYLRRASLLLKKKEWNRSSLFWLGILSYQREHFQSAIDYFDRVWKDSEAASEEDVRYALFWLSESFLKLGRFEEAKAHYSTFCARFRRGPLVQEAIWRLGLCEYRLGNRKASVEMLRSFKHQFKDSKWIGVTQYLLGEVLLVDGDYPSSITELNQVSGKPSGNFLWAASLLNLYWNYVNLGELDEANRVLQRLLKLDHFDDEKFLSQWLTGELIFYGGKVSESLPYYFNIINTKFREKALFQIGKGYFLESQFREAITNLDILFLEFPNSKYSDEGLFIKGECLFRTRDWARALEAYDLIIERNASPFWLLLALVQSGGIRSSRNENSIAAGLFRKVMAEFPNHPLFYHAAFQLGNLHFRGKDIVEAIRYYSIVLKGNMMDLLGEASFRLGEIFYQQGNYDKAFTNFERALRSLKETSLWFFLAQLEIGNLQRRWGKYEEARKSYRMILDHSKDEEIKQAAKEMLIHIDTDMIR